MRAQALKKNQEYIFYGATENYCGEPCGILLLDALTRHFLWSQHLSHPYSYKSSMNIICHLMDSTGPMHKLHWVDNSDWEVNAMPANEQSELHYGSFCKSGSFTCGLSSSRCTQTLESMIKTLRPTHTEAVVVAHAALDGIGRERRENNRAYPCEIC